jgi:cobalt/nickel transport system permease protein
MHIPDGYLSPATCAAAYAAAAPFWFIAFRKVKRLLHTKLVPLLAVFSAFSFVVMMFNLPLPGGTTGHAAGLAIAAIVLGPWAAILAISIALLIQAVFFGDGGITAFGANAFNMAIVGVFGSYFFYRLIAGQSAIDSPRRVFAAAAAGYVGMNLAGFVTSIEFGLQPLFFQDASGAPLYAPYPLSIAIPAMAIGHLSFAGLAELAITAGLVYYLQRSNPDLLAFSAIPSERAESGQAVETAAGWKATRDLWVGLALMMILSPLGLIAAGVAWGEWSPDDFQDEEIRRQMTIASGNVAPPESAPSGMQRLADFWTAPIPDYAPAFLKDEHFGYVVSAFVGTGLIVLLLLGLSWCYSTFAASPRRSG